MFIGNKWEWSEVYVLLRLLAEEKIYANDNELNKLEDVYFPIIKVLREENKGEIKEYTAGEMISIYIDGAKVKELPVTEFESEYGNLLNEINSKDSKCTFPVESTQNFIDKILCYKIFTPATDKSDIKVKIIDADTVYSPTIGSSMKSELGSSPTLLNAGKTTNFIYKIVHNHPDLIREANGIYKVSGGKNHTDVRGRINKIIKENGTLEYRKMNNQIFEDNLWIKLLLKPFYIFIKTESATAMRWLKNLNRKIL